MTDFYVYLLSSLPMLQFGTEAPFSFSQFLEKCQPLIPAQDFLILANLAQPGDSKIPLEIPLAVRQWLDFETALRNALILLRSSRRHLEPQKYLRPENPGNYSVSELNQLALNAQRNPSPLEAERLLDQRRWQFLEELNFGHYFDFTALIVYAYKLLLLERWERIHRADKTQLLEAVLEGA